VANCLADKRAIDWSTIVKSPLSAESSVPIMCNNVLLPDPDFPTILTISPCATFKSTPLRILSCP